MQDTFLLLSEVKSRVRVDTLTRPFTKPLSFCALVLVELKDNIVRGEVSVFKVVGLAQQLFSSDTIYKTQVTFFKWRIFIGYYLKLAQIE